MEEMYQLILPGFRLHFRLYTYLSAIDHWGVAVKWIEQGLKLYTNTFYPTQ